MTRCLKASRPACQPGCGEQLRGFFEKRRNVGAQPDASQTASNAIRLWTERLVQLNLLNCIMQMTIPHTIIAYLCRLFSWSAVGNEWPCQTGFCQPLLLERTELTHSSSQTLSAGQSYFPRGQGTIFTLGNVLGFVCVCLYVCLTVLTVNWDGIILNFVSR